jgi:hypothetical protein
MYVFSTVCAVTPTCGDGVDAGVELFGDGLGGDRGSVEFGGGDEVID